MEINENVGHDVTFKIINSSSNKIKNASNIRPITNSKAPNLRSDPATSPEEIKSLREDKFKAEDFDS